MSLGMTIVIITGGIDLSVGSVCAMVAVCSMIVMRSVANSPLAGAPYATVVVPVVAGLVLAGVIGMINGLLIALLDLSPFVTTLGMLSICRGLTYVITQGRGQAPPVRMSTRFFAVTNGHLAGLPVQVDLRAGGRGGARSGAATTASGAGHLFAVGGSEPAAMRTGVRVNRVKISAYVLCSLAAGAAGILLAGWLGSAPANLASGYELRVIAATVIGGANLAGGSGGPVGAVIGSALIEVIRNSLVLGRVDAYWQDALIGLIIILAVLVDKLRVLQAK